jgi:hypothetical protein
MEITQAAIDALVADMRGRMSDAPPAVVDMLDRFTTALRRYAAPALLTDTQFGVVLTVVSSMMMDPNIPAETIRGVSHILAMAGQRFYDGTAQ